MNSLSIVFAGTPAFGLPCLNALMRSPHELKAIYTQPDRKAGRGQKLQLSPVKTWANEHAYPLLQPLHFKDEETLDTLASFNPDVIIVIAYGLILPSRVLNIPRYGCINVHASLLPRWRGASPIQQAILQGDKETGVTIMQMDAGMDTGGMIEKSRCPIHQETAGELHDRLAEMAVTPLLSTLEAMTKGDLFVTEQNADLATYAPKITKENAAINWTKKAIEIERQVRAFNPWPIAYTHADDTTLRIHEAYSVSMMHSAPPGTILSIDKQGLVVATGENALSIQRLQRPGGKAVSIADWLNSGRDLLHVNMTLK